MVGGPLTGGSFNPARWFGPALVGNDWGGVWPYIVGPIVGCAARRRVYKFVIEAAVRAGPDRAARAGVKARAASAVLRTFGSSTAARRT